MKYLLILILTSIAAISTGQAAPHNVTLAWVRSPDTNVVGYTVWWGKASVMWTEAQDAGNADTATIKDVPAGTYYFVVIARNADGLESAPSNEVSTTLVDPPAPPSNLRITSTKLANLSTRAFIQTADNVLIGGFIISGAGQKKLMVRAIGPSVPLDQHLLDPEIEVHDASGQIIAENDNWADDGNVREVIESALAPTDQRESAVLRDFAPGAYTVIVRGHNDSIGIALVEIYDLDKS